MLNINNHFSNLKIRAFALAAVVLLITLINDSRFPFPKSISEIYYQLALLPLTLLIVVIILFYLGIFRLRIEKSSLFDKLTAFSFIRATALVAIIFEFLALALILVSNYMGTRYQSLNIPITLGFFSILIACFVILYIRDHAADSFLFILLICAYIGSYGISIMYFPLFPGRSDMLYLIGEAGNRFLEGSNPYIFYSIPYTETYMLPLTYLPGLWLSYLPAVIAGIDLRFINMIAVLLTVTLLYISSGRKQRQVSLLFITVFLLNPYLQFRHDIYLGVYWLSLTASIMLLSTKKPVWSGFVFAISMCMAQLSWVLFPFFIVYVARSYGRKAVLTSITTVLLVSLATFTPFLAWSASGFYSGVFQHWNELISFETFNFTYWIQLIFTLHSLRYFQALVLLGLFIGYYFSRDRSLTGTVKWMALSIFFFLTLNSLIWTYLYLTVILLLVISIIVSENETNGTIH